MYVEKRRKLLMMQAIIQVLLQQRSLKDSQRTSSLLTPMTSVNFNRTCSNSSYEFDDKRAKIIYLFPERDDTKSYRTGARSEPPSLAKNNIVFRRID